MAKLEASTLLEVAEQAVKAWDFRVSQIEHIATSENTVFRVETETGKTYTLRIHRPGYHTLAELNAEQQWTAALNQAGIGVPKPVMTQDGRGYATVHVPKSTETRHVGMAEWIDGIPLARVMKETSDERVLVQYFDQLGRIAARIHNQATNWQLPDGFQRHAFDADGLMGDTPFWGPFWDLPEMEDSERRLILKTRNAIHQTLSEYGKQRGTYSLIHADLHPYNLLVNGTRLYAIDFDDSGFGWHQYELAVALFNSQNTPHFEALQNALLSGYRSERAFDDAAIELLPMFLLIRALALLGWTHERPEIGRGRLKGLIASACAQAEDLLSS